MELTGIQDVRTLQPLLVNRKWLFPGSVALLSLACFLFLSPDQRRIALPALTILNIFTWFFAALWKRDRKLPLFDVGVMCVAFTSCYAMIPLIMHLLSGMQWTVLSDSRLYNYSPSPAEFGNFAWMPAAYIVSIAIAYAMTRGKTPINSGTVEVPDRPTIIVLLAMAAVIIGFFSVVDFLTGINLSFTQSYETERALIATGTLQQAPLLLRQAAHNLFGMLTIIKYALIACLLLNWGKAQYRYALYSWMILEIFSAIRTMGSRSYVVFLLIAATLAYHRLVKPVKLALAFAFALLLLTSVLLYGYFRDYRDAASTIEPDTSLLSVATEFQILYGTSYDLTQRRADGTLGDIPWQVYLSDLLLVVPQQILPVEKVDPAEWYLDVLGLRSTGLGLMFGVVSQAAIGFGWPELILRGAILGFLLGLFHRWYVSRSSSFWATILYLWIGIWSYYSFRATTFYVLTFIVYRFLPVFILANAASHVAKAFRGRAGSPATA